MRVFAYKPFAWVFLMLALSACTGNIGAVAKQSSIDWEEATYSDNYLVADRPYISSY